MSSASITATELKKEQYGHLLRKYIEIYPDADKSKLFKKSSNDLPKGNNNNSNTTKTVPTRMEVNITYQCNNT
jgi:hypothetical protein